MTTVNKVQFASLSSRRYYFLDGIASLPFEYPLLSDLPELKNSYSKNEKDKLLRLENQAVVKHERPRVLRSIYSQPINYYKLNGNTKVNQKDSFDFRTTCDYILNSKWL